MIEQMVRSVETENTVDGTTLRFGPLGNKSHKMVILKAIEDKVKKPFVRKIENESVPLSEKEKQDYFYNEAFPTLEIMNERGWKLESFSTIYDSNQLHMQIAIFTKETLP